MSKITQVSIEIGGKTIKLSLEEAKELRDILSDAFPVLTSTPTWIGYPYPVTPWYWQYTYTNEASGGCVMSLTSNGNTYE